MVGLFRQAAGRWWGLQGWFWSLGPVDFTWIIFRLASRGRGVIHGERLNTITTVTS